MCIVRFDRRLSGFEIEHPRIKHRNGLRLNTAEHCGPTSLKHVCMCVITNQIFITSLAMGH